MTTDWKETTVADLVNNDFLFPPLDGNHGEIHPKNEDFVASGVPFIMASDLINGDIDFSHCKFISEKQAKTLRKGFAHNGDVLLSHKATLGRTAIVKANYDYIVLTPQVTYYRIKNKNKLSNQFLKYYFDSPFFQRTMLNYAGGGSTRDYIGITKQLDLPIIFPPLPEQKAIAAVLSSFDDKIELLRRQNKTLESIAQTIFKEWFINFTVQGKKLKINPKTNLPEGWKRGKLDEVIQIYGGGTPKTDITEYWNGNIPWFSVADVPSDSDVFTIRCEKHITKEGLENSSTRVLPLNTTIITARGTVGKLALTGVPMAMNQSCYGLYPADGKSVFYVYLIAKESLSALKQQVHGAVFDTITRDTLNNISINIPDDKIVEMFEKTVKPYFHKALQNNFQIHTLSKLRDTLLPKLMKGEIRVNNQ